MRKSRRLLIAVIAMGSVVGAAAPSHAAEVGTDTAVPRWNTSTTASKMTCGSGVSTCTLTVTTVTTGGNCESEVITISSSPTPGLLYSNTQCTATLTVVFDENRVQGEACLLSFSDASLTFNSGVNSFFNGTWRRGIVGTFVPTFSRENPPDWIDGGTVSVKGVGQHPVRDGEHGGPYRQVRDQLLRGSQQELHHYVHRLSPPACTFDDPRAEEHDLERGRSL